jgi:hypothetical protein
MFSDGGGRLTVEVFQVAYDIIGGGEEGEKRLVRSKEQADHSLPYLVAVALLDGHVLPPQFAPDRIVQLLEKLERIRIADLCSLLGRPGSQRLASARPPSARAARRSATR